LSAIAIDIGHADATLPPYCHYARYCHAIYFADIFDLRHFS
jgi:hypothetical protein